ncbi:hypothetical protein BKA65DRAFT_510601 [Rhexocercosporidium sp. MPI-PUGE-AT-0058]|nr:hypothetical protein BKA65DRAFT_510601 [Rhexocercosporidium sp. MPI-PUGE-AT-0058]
MSAEVAKKRGRPKKVISDPVEVERPETAKKGTTRAKSTKTVAKTTKATLVASAKGNGVKKSVPKAAGASASSKIASKMNVAPAKPVVKETEKPTAAKHTPTSPTTTTTSKILEQVKEMEVKKTALPQQPAKGTTGTASKASIPEVVNKVGGSRQELKQSTEASKPQSIVASKSNPVSSQQKSSPPTKSLDPRPTAKQPPPPPGKSTPPPPAQSVKPTPKPTPHVPIAELNSKIVSNITTRAGARPNTSGSQQLPKNYKPVARKVTMAIVALPILIVTSYVLYQRLVLGEEKKMLVPPQSKPVHVDVKKAEPSNTSAEPSQ